MSDDTREEEESEGPTTFSGFIRENLYVSFLAVTFMIIGAVASPYVFPDLHPLRAALGGVFFGAFCTMCAALPKML